MPHPDPQGVNPAAAPPRVLGLLDATCVVIGAIIGVGIFFTPASMAGLVGSGPLLMLAWVIAGAVALCGALAFAELGGMYSASGAQYQILRDAFGSLVAFLFVFCNATAIQAGTIGIIAVVCARHIAAAAGVADLTGWPLLASSSSLVVGVTVANVVGARWGARIQNLTVFAKVATLAAVAVLAAVAGRHAINEPAAASASTLSPAMAVLAALVPAFFAFGGWQQALWVAGEVREPGRTLPRAILVGVIIVVVVYLAANWAYLSLLGIDRMAATRTLAADAAAAGLNDTGGMVGRVVAGLVAVSAFGVLNAQLLSGPRLIYGMACDGRFLRSFARLSHRAGTPVHAILLLSGTALVLLLAAGADGIDRLLTGTVFIDGVFFALTGAAVFVLRRTRPDALRSVRTPGYPIVPAIFVLGAAAVVAGAYVDPVRRAAVWIGMVWIAAAAMVYLIWFRRDRDAPIRAP